MVKAIKQVCVAVIGALAIVASFGAVAFADDVPTNVSTFEEGSGTVSSQAGNKFAGFSYYGTYEWKYDSTSKTLTVTFLEKHASLAEGTKGSVPEEPTYCDWCFDRSLAESVESLELKGFERIAPQTTHLSEVKSIACSKDLKSTGNFSQYEKLKSVSFAEDSALSEVPSGSFDGCPLESIDFSNCLNLKVIEGKAPDNAELNNGKNGPWGYSQKPNTTLEKVILPSTLEKLGYKAFEYCTVLKSINLPESLTEIGTDAFKECDSLVKLEIPANVSKIDENAFKKTGNLSAIVIHSSNISGFASTQVEMGCELLKPDNKQRSKDSKTEIIVSDCVETPQVLQEWLNKAGDGAYKPAKVTCLLKYVNAIKELDVKSLDDEQALTDAKTGYEDLSEAAKGCLGDAVNNELENKIKAEEAKLDAIKNPSVTPPSGGDTGGGSGGSGGGGGSVAPTPSQHEHVWGTGVETVKATCTTAGTMTYHCTVSGCTETKTEAIPALGHKFGEWVVTTPATTQAAGVETRTCSVCGATETRAIDKIADGSGSGSGTVTPGGDKVTVGTTVKVSGITYKVTASGKVKVSAVSKSVKGKKTVTIPATVKVKGKTYKVTGISAKILKGAKATTLVIKSKTLTKKGVKNSLKGSKVKTVKIAVSGKKTVNKTYVSKYKKFFTKANCGKSVKLLAA